MPTPSIKEVIERQPAWVANLERAVREMDLMPVLLEMCNLNNEEIIISMQKAKEDVLTFFRGYRYHGALKEAGALASPWFVALGTTLLQSLVPSLLLTGQGNKSAVSRVRGHAELHHQAARRSAQVVLPALIAGMTLLPNLVPSLLLTGKGKNTGKSNRRPKAANHGARPCNHVGRHRRSRAAGRYKYSPRK